MDQLPRKTTLLLTSSIHRAGSCTPIRKVCSLLLILEIFPMPFVILERAIFWLSTFVFVLTLNSLKSRSAFKKLQKAPGDTSVEEITPLTNQW